MAHPQLVVRDAVIVLPEAGLLNGHVVVEDGKVSRLLPISEPAPDAERTVDAAGRFVLPGAIDPHCHYGLIPPLSERVAPESAFAALGGITTLVRYFRRTDSYLQSLPPHIAADPAYHYQDFSVHLAIFNEAQVAEIPRYVEELGITSFKMYTNLKAAVAKGFLIDPLVDDTELQTADLDYDDGLLISVMEALAALPVRTRLSVHVEEADLVIRQTERVRALGLEGLLAWHYARPEEAEALGVRKVAYLSRQLGVPVYFPHIGSRLAIEVLVEELAVGTDLVAETCPHYLVHNVESPAANLLKVMPPVRTKEDNLATWKALREGVLSTIGTDHIPYPEEVKRGADIWKTRPGFGSFGLMVPVMLSAGVNSGKLTIGQVAQVTSTNVAKAFGLYPMKGSLLPGSDADLIVVDLDREWTVHAADLASLQSFSVYEGMRLRGGVDVTVSRGEVICEDGHMSVDPGRGCFISRYPQLRRLPA